MLGGRSSMSGEAFSFAGTLGSTKGHPPVSSRLQPEAYAEHRRRTPTGHSASICVEVNCTNHPRTAFKHDSVLLQKQKAMLRNSKHRFDLLFGPRLVAVWIVHRPFFLPVSNDYCWRIWSFGAVSDGATLIATAFFGDITTKSLEQFALAPIKVYPEGASPRPVESME